MRSAPSGLVAYLNTLRGQTDAQLFMADCFTLTLRSGLILTYTNADAAIALNGYTYAANSLLVDGLHYRCAVGLDVDQQKITLIARTSDTIGGTPILQALRNGAFDGCQIQRDRAFLSGVGTTPIGAVTLFKGRVATIDQIGRTTAEITVNSDLTLLDIDMPRNLYQPTCVHTLFDAGCGLVKNAFGVAGAVGAGSSNLAINWSGASTIYTQGTITFSSGTNIGVTASIKGATSSVLGLAYPLNAAPSAGDAFTVYQGCDHTMTTCRTKFGNLANFRGFPYIPPPVNALSP